MKIHAKAEVYFWKYTRPGFVLILLFSHFFLLRNSLASEKKVKADNDSPNILGLRLKGIETLVIVSINVVPPPRIIAHNAATGGGFFIKKAPITGNSNPETIKA